MKNLNKTNTAKKAYFIAGMLFIIATMFFLITNSKISASPGTAKILFNEEIHDFGKVEQGTLLEHSFKFTNDGDKPLVIEKVQPSCGCTGATVSEKTEYAEGENGEIKITFNTQGREGHQEKHITVYSNDTDNPQKNLKFTCDIDSGNR